MPASRILFPLLARSGPSVVLPRLRVRGHCFEQEDGTRFTVIQCSDFFLYGRYLNGEDIRPVLQQRRDCGFNMLRVWTRMQLAQFGIGDCTFAQHPDFYNRLADFLNLCARYGLYVELTAYFGLDQDYDREHWDLLGLYGRDCTNWIAELVNEHDQGGSNAIDLTAFEPISDRLCSHGSNGSQEQPCAPYWNYVTFHTNMAFEEQRKVGHNAMEIWQGPSLTNETSRYPDGGGMWSVPFEQQLTRAYDAAAGAALLCAGACFHSVQGKNSTPWDNRTLSIAGAFVNGAKSVDLSQQDEPYQHRPDLETPDLLRVYQRGTAIVEIRQ